jgi:DNA-directed RNA polymerase specialized sigma24 family protein
LAQRSARGFLRRFEDSLTRSAREDLVQETAWAAWQWAASMRDTSRFDAAVRTIARRTRCRLIDAERRRRELDSLAPPDGEPVAYEVAGHRVPLVWLLGCLQTVLAGLRELDRRLLIGLHEGFCCAELAARFRRSEQSVKVRIHRVRRVVQWEIEKAVLAADELDGVFENPVRKKPKGRKR